MSQELRDANRELPWRKMTGTRDRLIHGYFDVNLDLVWGTVTEELPVLVRQIERLLNDTRS